MKRAKRSGQRSGLGVAGMLLLLLALAWLSAWAWHARKAPAWAAGWVGWFSASAEGSQPLWHWGAAQDSGWELVSEGNSFYRVSVSKPLGRWRYPDRPWTWLGWVRIRTEQEFPPGMFHVIWRASSGRAEALVGITNGAPALSIRARPRVSHDPWASLKVAGKSAFPLREWVHLGVASDGSHTRLIVNGTEAAQWTSAPFEVLHQAELELCSLGATAFAPPVVSTDHDDIVLFDRALPTHEIAALAAAGRGAWEAEMQRPQRAAALRKGGMLLLPGVALLLGVRLLGWPKRAGFQKMGKVLRSPAGPPIVWVTLAGFAATALFSAAVHRHGRSADEAKFASLLNQLRVDTDQYWEGLAGFLLRARDWIAAQGELSQEKWEAWLTSNHFPHDHPGVTGVGYAEQVLPGGLAAHEKSWSERNGMDHRVTPAAPQRHDFEDFELAGSPRLPVVLFRPRDVPAELWRTNQAIFGRDLLQHEPGDWRLWPDGRRVEKAVARNEITSSDVEQIAPAEWYGKPVSGLRLYVPWTLEQKRDDRIPLEPGQWRGVLFASVDMAELIKLHFSDAPPQIGFRLFTGSQSQRLRLVADTSDIIPGTRERARAYFKRSFRTPLYHYELLFDAWTTSSFETLSTRRWPAVTMAGGSALTLLAAGLLCVQGLKRLEQAALIAALTAANADLRTSSQERERLSRDLHDGSIQNLYGLGLLLKRLEQLLPGEARGARENLSEALALLDESISDLRRFVFRESSAAESNTTASAIAALVERWRGDAGRHIELELHPAAAELPPRTGIHLLNVLREAISNSIRHGQATVLRIRLGPAPLNGLWRLSIEDNGRGFRPGGEAHSGRGLNNFAARAQELDGTARVESEPGKGTLVVIEFRPAFAGKNAETAPLS